MHFCMQKVDFFHLKNFRHIVRKEKQQLRSQKSRLNKFHTIMDRFSWKMTSGGLYPTPCSKHIHHHSQTEQLRARSWLMEMLPPLWATSHGYATLLGKNYFFPAHQRFLCCRGTCWLPREGYCSVFVVPFFKVEDAVRYLSTFSLPG